MDALKMEYNNGQGFSDVIRIRSLLAESAAAWDAFVEQSPDATFFHLSGWRHVIEDAFGHPTHYLYAESGGEVVGVLPLVHVKSRLFTNALISTPFCVYGGAVARDERARHSLEQAACVLAEKLQVDYLELRQRRLLHPEWPVKRLYVTFRKQIDSDSERNLQSIPRKQRAMIRKGMKAGLRASVDLGTDRLYDAYSESVRNLGTPVFSKRYLQLLKAVFEERCEVLTVTEGGAVVASVMSFYFRDEVLPYYGGGKERARSVMANDFMYWEVMSRAAEHGARLFDYGRSKIDSGSYRFKKHWGFEPEPLYYEYYLVKARSMPNLSPANPKYRIFIEAWKRLPVPVSRFLGPPLARNLG